MDDKVEVYLERVENSKGEAVISREKARREEAWDRMEKAYSDEVRVDGAIFQGYKVTPYYDSMVCKLICHGRNRTEAIQRMNRSLDEFVIEGITTTIPLHKKLLSHKKFINSDFNVSWLDKDTIV